MSQNTDSIGGDFPMLLSQKRLERVLRVLEDRPRIWAAFANPVAGIINEQKACIRITKSANQT